MPEVLDQLILGARVASAAGDAGLRARVLQATEVLERERPGVPLFAAVASMPAGYSSVTPMRVGGCRRVAVVVRGRFFTPAPPRTPALNSRAPAQR